MTGQDFQSMYQAMDTAYCGAQDCIAALEAENAMLREALEMADRLLTSHAIASGKYWRKPFATRHEMTHGKIRAALKETK